MAHYALAASSCPTSFSPKLAITPTEISRPQVSSLFFRHSNSLSLTALQITRALPMLTVFAARSTGNVYPMASATWRMNNTTVVTHVPIGPGRPQVAQRYAPMVRTPNTETLVRMYVLISLQETQILETRPFFNVQDRVEIGVATTIGIHLMSVATAPTQMTSFHCPRGLLWPR